MVIVKKFLKVQHIILMYLSNVPVFNKQFCCNKKLAKQKYLKIYSLQLIIMINYSFGMLKVYIF